MPRLFGTDGIRDIANSRLSPLLAYKAGRAGAYVLTKEAQKDRLRVVVGRDTRISGTMLQHALTAGINSAGVDVLDVGVMPTPAIAYLTRALGADAGVVISASHNPVDTTASSSSRAKDSSSWMRWRRRSSSFCYTLTVVSTSQLMTGPISHGRRYWSDDQGSRCGGSLC